MTNFLYFLLERSYFVICSFSAKSNQEQILIYLFLEKSFFVFQTIIFLKISKVSLSDLSCIWVPNRFFVKRFRLLGDHWTHFPIKHWPYLLWKFVKISLLALFFRSISSKIFDFHFVLIYLRGTGSEIDFCWEFWNSRAR